MHMHTDTDTHTHTSPYTHVTPRHFPGHPESSKTQIRNPILRPNVVLHIVAHSCLVIKELPTCPHHLLYCCCWTSFCSSTQKHCQIPSMSSAVKKKCHMGVSFSYFSDSLTYVVDFDQCLDDGHSKRWSKNAFYYFSYQKCN